MLWIAIVLAGLMMLGFVLLLRRRRPAAAKLSPMRATLERRLREGREFHL